MSALFEPLTLRGTTFAHRAWVSPMCQYSAVDGVVRRVLGRVGARRLGRGERPWGLVGRVRVVVGRWLRVHGLWL